MTPLESVLCILNHGKDEGIARAVSQVVVYTLERRKTLCQLNGFVPQSTASLRRQFHEWGIGVSTSAVLAGVVFMSYFSIYNSMGMACNPLAAPTASFLTSFIKVPISNGMRLLQCGRARSFVQAIRMIHKINKVQGFYKGYALALVDDIIEMEVRNRICEHFISRDNSACLNIGIGMSACSIAAGLTTPFDVVRMHMCVNQQCAIQTAKTLLRTHGPAVLYRGATIRCQSTAAKSIVFFLVYEMLKHSKSQKLSGTPKP